MAATYALTTEFFAIPYRGETFIIYSPLKEILMLANRDMVELIAALRDGTFQGVTGENIDAMQLLLEAKAVNGLADVPPSHEFPAEWKPTEVTLFLTNECNLRCSYCYASAGEHRGMLPVSTALASVELVARNALEAGQSEFRVSFHGGGEPTLAWQTLTASVERAEALARASGLNVTFNLASNGVIPSSKVDWLVRHFHDFSISYDGPTWIHDRHRRTPSGSGSAQTVEATLRHLDSHSARYGVRVTVTQESVAFLPEIVSNLLERFSPAAVHFEPLFSHGRAQARGLSAPDARAFVAGFREARTLVERHGLDLYYSGARTELVTDTFCGAADGSFNVTPEGLLTSCFEVCHEGDELAASFFYGRSNAQGGFDIDRGRLATIAAHTVRERPECEGCFCRWHCAGDCIAKNMIADRHGSSMKAARCLINQELSRDQLVRRLEQHSRIMRQVEAGASQEGLEPLVPLIGDLRGERSTVEPLTALMSSLTPTVVESRDTGQ